MTQTRVSFSTIGISFDKKRRVLHYPVLWVFNPQTGRCRRYNHFELRDEITKDCYRGFAETAEFVLVLTDSCYYTFSSKDGSLIAKSSRQDIGGAIIGVQNEGVLFRNNNLLVLINEELKEIGRRELSMEEIEELDR